MRTLLSKTLFVIVCLLLSINASGYDFKYGGLCYNLIGLNQVEVTASEDLYEGLTDVVIPEYFTIGDIKYNVVQIGSKAFYDCATIKTVQIPNTVTNIVDSYISGSLKGAFAYCTALEKINIPGSIKSFASFRGCTSLKEVALNEGLETLDAGTFEDCTSLISIKLPNSLINLNGYYNYWNFGAFTGCSSLESVTFGSGLITTIGANTFSGCAALKEIIIPNSVESIECGAFKNCTSLQYIKLGTNVKIIGGGSDLGAFQGCSSLERIDMNDKLETIDMNSFSGCSKLPSITIPNSVTSIGSRAFSGCAGLISITLPSNITSIEGSTFNGCTNLTSITIPNSLTLIGESAFYGCTGLTSITLPSSITSIEGSTFSNCSSLESIDIPNSVTSIGSSAFSGCTGLTSIVIPNSITYIGGSAFSGCSGIKNIYNHMLSPLNISSTVFKSIDRSSCNLYVLNGSATDYKSASVWKDFLNIKEFDPAGVENITDNNLKIFILGTDLNISGVEDNTPIELYNTSGKLIYCGNNRTITVPTHGSYIVKVGNTIQKVVL